MCMFDGVRDVQGLDHLVFLSRLVLYGNSIADVNVSVRLRL